MSKCPTLVVLVLLQSLLFLLCVSNFLLLRTTSLDAIHPAQHRALLSTSAKEGESPLASRSRNLRPVDPQLTAATRRTADDTQYQDATTKTSGSPFRMLLGIFTTDTPKDFNRRRLIRRTYLSYYDQINRASKITGHQWTSNRICALADIMAGNATNPEDCQLIYTFVVGGADPSDPQAPTELLEDDPNIPMVLDSPSDQHERDVTYLNIRENMNEGKTVTWFKYASSRIPDGLRIDLIAKVDTDTVVLPPSLLNEVEIQLRAQDNMRPPKLVYGGHAITSRHYYIQGGFYFLSKDLAQYITSDSCPRDEIVRAHMIKHGHRAEDREVGAFVKRRERGSAQKAQRLFLPYKIGSEHCKRFKGEEGFLSKWEGFLAKETARQQYNGLLVEGQHSGLPDNTAVARGSIPPPCPSEEAIHKALGQYRYGGADSLPLSTDGEVVLNTTRAKDELINLLGSCVPVTLVGLS
jgi:hypothetical protein